MLQSNIYKLSKSQVIKELQQSRDTKFEICEVFSNEEIKEVEKLLKKYVQKNHVSLIIIEN